MTRFVLAVEDDLREQLMISRAVADFSAEVRLITVETGGDALDYVARRGPYEWRRPDESPNMVISDHDLPDMLALDLVRLLREDDATRDLPVFVYADSLNGDARRYGELEVDGPIAKPQDETTFRRTLVEALTRHLAS